MNTITINILGVIIMIFGLLIAFLFGGVQGFSAGASAAIAYIGGFTIAFVGAYYAFLFGRQKNRNQEE